MKTVKCLNSKNFKKEWSKCCTILLQKTGEAETDKLRTWGCNEECSRRALNDLIRLSNRFSRYNLLYNLKQ